MLGLLIKAIGTVLSLKFVSGLIIGAVIGGPALLKAWGVAFGWVKARFGK